MKDLLVLLSHPFVERLIGTIRREYLDQILLCNAVDMERKLAEFRAYYNVRRVHSSLGDQTPAEVSRQRVTARANVHNFRWKSHCRGLYQLPVAA